MIQLDFLKGKKVAVLGLGKTGITAARALVASGAIVHAWDDNEHGRHTAEKEEIPLVDLGAVDFTDGYEMLVLSPGIAHTHPAPHPVPNAARKANVEVIGDIELLYRACPDASYIGITGTNGKSTTTALTGHILKKAGLKVEIGGNIGAPALTLEPLGKDGIYVLELSSYQLELCPSLACDIACILNITPDHLERHGGMAGYIGAKKNLLKQQKDGAHALIGIDDNITKAIEAEAITEKRLKVIPISAVCTPMMGVSAAGGKLSMRLEALKETGLFEHTLLKFQEFARLPGRHNWQNIAFAATIGILKGLTIEQLDTGVRTFPGLPHRQQLLGFIDGIRFVNDSKATNAEAAAKALVCYDPIYWIAGGIAKEGGLDGLEDYMPRIKHCFLIGDAQNDFEVWLDGKTQTTKCDTLDKAVKAAYQKLKNDGVKEATLLLSPACASFDQFPSFEARGEAFENMVRDLMEHKSPNA